LVVIGAGLSRKRERTRKEEPMRSPRNPGLARFVRDSAPTAARRLFAKARLAGNIAHVALNRRSRDAAREAKQRLLDAALRVDPHLFRRYPDPRAGRWVYRLQGGDAMHGRCMQDLA
jgi:hypothetical protein